MISIPIACVPDSLQYYLDPARVAREEEEVDHLFESDFERDVYHLIATRGYAVRPPGYGWDP